MSHSANTRPGGSGRRGNTHRSTLSMQKTEIKINVYDLLPPGKLSTFLWTVGGSLLHSGVVINNREYAYGGHERLNTSGVYWTKPQLEPPGGTFRCELLHGFSYLTSDELDEVIREASNKFLGTSYNLLTNNCNHFTSYLCQKLTSRSAPGWLNRAASIGVALPCVVPREWIAPPDHETADGELLNNEEGDDERSSMLRTDQPRRKRPSHEEQNSWDDEMDRISRSETGSSRRSRLKLKDTSGRDVPPSERAPLPKG